MRAPFARFGRFLGELARAQHRDQLLVRAAALAYTTLLSIVPLLTVALVTVGRVNPGEAESVVRGIAAVLPFSPDQVQNTLALFAQRTAKLGWIAVVISALVTINAFYQIEEVLNAVWGVPHRRPWQVRLASFAALLVWGPILLTALFSMLYWVSSLPWYVSLGFATRPLPALFAVAVLAALYRWVPHTRVPWRAALGGAVVATSALVALHVGFQYYLDVARDLNVIYGSLVLLLFFLVSLLLLWFAVLLGAEASWVLGHGPREPQAELRVVLDALIETARDGGLTDARAHAVLGDRTRAIVQRLARPPEILTRTDAGWRLARSAEDITVAEVRDRVAVAGAAVVAENTAALTIASLVKQIEDAHASGPHPMPEGASAADLPAAEHKT